MTGFSVIQGEKAKLSKTGFQNIFGASKAATADYYKDIGKASDAMANPDADGNITLSNGRKIDINSVAGMTVFTTHIQLLQAHMEMVNNIMTFLKGLENKLVGMLS